MGWLKCHLEWAVIPSSVRCWESSTTNENTLGSVEQLAGSGSILLCKGSFSIKLKWNDLILKITLAQEYG